MKKGKRNPRSRFQGLLEFFRRISGREPESPRDPYTNRLAPLARGPRGRSGAAAVAEPEEDIYRSFPPRRQ